MPSKILIPLQSLISCFLEPPMNRRMAVGAVEGLWQGLLLSVSQRLHYLLGPSSCYPSGWGSSVLNLIYAMDQANEKMKTVSSGQVFSRFSSKL